MIMTTARSNVPQWAENSQNNACMFVAVVIFHIMTTVENHTGIAEVTGSNPVKALIFSGFFFSAA